MANSNPLPVPISPLNLNFAYGNSPEIHALILERFTYKQWDDDQVQHGKAVTGGAIDFASAIVEHVPPSATRTRALNLIEEARMLANAAITHDGKF